MKFVLKTGHTIFFDKEDVHHLMCTSWLVCSSGYLRSSVNSTPTSFHRIILGNPGGGIDHINGNKLDNRKINLRICDQSVNGFNKGKLKVHTSKYRGVCWSKKRKQWRSAINKNGKHIFLGYFTNEYDAYVAYTTKAKEIYGFLPYGLREI